MGNFHRFSDPTYFLFSGESFPTAPGDTGTVGGHTYDRLNVVSAGTGADGSAPAAGQNGSAVNQYTYFVHFGEDATSAAFNRGLRAAGESLDVLDDILRTSLPKLATQSGAAPGTNGIQITGTVFCGHSGAQPPSELVAAARSTSLNPLYNGTTQVAPTDIDDGTPGNSVIGTGWVVNPTVRFNTSVTQAYTLYYGARTTYARVSENEPGVWWGADMAALVRGLTNKGIFTHGFNELYRRSSALTLNNPELDTPGSGAVIRRDGPALTVRVPNTEDYREARPPNPWQAAYLVDQEVNGGLATTTAGAGGTIGLLSLTGFVSSDHASVLSSGSSIGSLLAQYIPRDIQSGTLYAGEAALTRIAAGASAVLNPAGVSNYIQLDAPSYFRLGGETAIHTQGRDVLLVTFPGGSQQVFYIDGIVTDDTASLLTLGKDVPVFAENTPVTVQWFSAHVRLGDLVYAGLGGGSAASLFCQPERLTAAGAEGSTAQAHEWWARVRAPGYFERAARQVLLRVGHFTPGGAANTHLLLYGDGTLDSQVSSEGQSGYLRHAFVHRSLRENVGSGTSALTVTFDPSNNVAAGTEGALGAGYSQILADLSSGTVNSPLEITVDTEELLDGTLCELIVVNQVGRSVTMVWDTSFRFSDPSDAQFGPVNGTPDYIICWRCTVVNAKILVERIDYPPQA